MLDRQREQPSPVRNHRNRSVRFGSSRGLAGSCFALDAPATVNECRHVVERQHPPYQDQSQNPLRAEERTFQQQAHL